MNTTAPRLIVRCDYLTRHDIPALLTIEQLCFQYPWRETETLRYLRSNSVIGLAAKDTANRLVGYAIFEVKPKHLYLANLAVDPSRQRWGVGTQIMRTLKNRLSPERRARIFCEVRETNVDGQLFFKSQGFRAVSVLKDFYDETEEDAYVMQYRVPRCENETKPNAK